MSTRVWQSLVFKNGEIGSMLQEQQVEKEALSNASKGMTKKLD